MSTARALWTRLQPSPLQQQTREVLADLRHDLHSSLDDHRQPTDAVLRHLRMSNALNHLWGCLKNAKRYPAQPAGPSLRTADMHDAAMAIAREAVCLAAECDLLLKEQRHQAALKAAEADWFDAVEQDNVTALRETDSVAEQRELQTLKKHDRQVHANQMGWGVRVLLVAAALAALSAMSACGGGGELDAEEEATVPVPQNLCAANPKVCI